MEHRCALFSPAAVGQQPRELTLQTVFVPPGEDGERHDMILVVLGATNIIFFIFFSQWHRGCGESSLKSTRNNLSSRRQRVDTQHSRV